MTNLEFFDVVKNHMKEYFSENGYSKCKIYKGRRNAICFEKKVEFYIVDIEFNWQTINETSIEHYFTIGFSSTWLFYDINKPRWPAWTFKTEDDLLNLLKEVPKKIEEQDFFRKVDEASYKYFHRNNIP